MIESATVDEVYDMTDGGGARARARQEEGKSWRGDDGQP